jgi:hypothetical protein
MKVQYTLVAEFPTDRAFDRFEKLARDFGNPFIFDSANLTCEKITPLDGSATLHRMKWLVQSIDSNEVPSDAVFDAKADLAETYGIRLARRIRKLEPDGSPGEAVEPTVFWTWGEAV